MSVALQRAWRKRMTAKVNMRHIPSKADRVDSNAFILNAWRHHSTRKLEEMLAPLANHSELAQNIRHVLALREERDRRLEAENKWQ